MHRKKGVDGRDKPGHDENERIPSSDARMTARGLLISAPRSGAGKTTVTLQARPHGAEPGEVAVFEGMSASLNQGFGGTFDQLEAVLAKA